MSEKESKEGLTQGLSRKNRLRHFVGDGVWASVCDGAAETNFHAFASTLTSSPHHISYLASLQNFAGCWFQLWSDKLVKLAGSPKRLVLAGVALQCLILLAMVLTALSGAGPLAFMGAIFLFTAVGGLAGPVWSAWVSGLLPKRRRGACYGIRNQRTYPAQFVALLGGGLLLQWLSADDPTLLQGTQLAFCVVFLIGLLAKLASLRHLLLQPDIDYHPPAKALGPTELITYSVRDPEMRRAVFFFAAMGFAVTISGPYQTPFMLKHLHMDYFLFAAATASLVLGRFLSAAPVGRLMDRHGYQRPLLLASFLMPLIPFGWTISSAFGWILFLQFAGGVIWTVFDLAVFAYISERSSPERRQRLFSMRHISWNLAASGGALLGGLLLSLSSMPLLVFWTSSLSRLGAAFFVIPALFPALLPSLGLLPKRNPQTQQTL